VEDPALILRHRAHHNGTEKIKLRDKHDKLQNFSMEAMLWLYARQPGTVSNRLNARQSNIFTKFPQKAFLKSHETICLCLEMSSVSKSYFGRVVDGIFSRGHTMKSL